MYISIKLPPAFGSFNRLRKENYPFNNLFTTYLAAVSRLGLALSMDVPELVGYIEDRVFDGMRLPDVPEGDGPVDMRYKTEDPDVAKYIGGSALTNRMAVMYIARMTLRLSAAYGTSLFRLTRLINDLDPAGAPAKAPRRAKEQAKEPVRPKVRPMQENPEPVKEEEEPVKEEPVKEEAKEEPVLPMPRISSRAAEQPAEPAPAASPALKSAEAAKAAVSELMELAAKASGEETPIVETNPYLSEFL